MEKKTKAWGISAMIFGILSLLFMFMPYFGMPLAILACVFYGKQRKIEPNGFGLAGLITGILGIVINSVTGFMALVMLSVIMAMG